MTEEVREAVRKYFPDYPVDSTDRLPLDIYGWLVCNVWAKERANWTPEQIREDFMNNEGRMGEFRYDG